METSVLKVVGQVAGIGGISLGVFLLLFREIIRKNIFPNLTKDQAYRLLRLISFYVWTVALAGIVAWVWSYGSTESSTGSTTISQKVSSGGTAISHTGTGDINVKKDPAK